MPGTTSFVKIKFAESLDETKAFPGEVSEPGAKTIDKFLEEHTLTLKSRAAGFEAKSGELSECTKALTVTLPLAATANQYIGVVANPAVATELVKITTSGGAFIGGDYVTIASKTATITLTEAQHVILQSDGTNWKILAGEPKREQKYEAKTFTKAEIEAGVTLSSTRLVLITIMVGTFENPLIGGVALPTGAFTGRTFEIPPGQTFKATVPGVNLECALLGL